MGRQFISNVKGVGVKTVTKQYYVSTSSTELIGGEWSSDVPTISDTGYLWSKWITEFTDNTKVETKPIQESVAAAFGGVAIENVVPIEKGGTGATSLFGARQTLNFLGINPFERIELDNPFNWVNLGTGTIFIDGANQIYDQPSNRGFIESYTTGDAICQVWHSFDNYANTFVRTGNKAGTWGVNWVGGDSVRIDELWVNASTSSIFEGQTITGVYDPSTVAYDFVIAVFNKSTDNGRKYVEISTRGYYGEVTAIELPDTGVGSDFALDIAQRRFVLTSGGDLTFNTCLGVNGGTSLNVVWERPDRLIPIAVYGVRGVNRG